MFKGEESFKVGDNVKCNIFYTGISSSEYFNRLELIAAGRQNDIQAKVDKENNNRKKGITPAMYMGVPEFYGAVTKITKVLNSFMITVKNYKDEEITLLDYCWNKKS